jgi:CRP-like cAMP-binding protein
MEMSTGVANKIEEFFKQYPLKSYDEGQLLILADENPKAIIHLISGNVREYDISYRGDEIVVNVFKPPAFFPMSWAINQQPNRYFFEAASKVVAREAPPEEVLEFLKQNPDVMLDLLGRLYRGVDGLMRRMAHLMGGSARSRLLFELIIEAKRFGKVGKDNSCAIDISETEIGARAGLSRETVSRELRELKKQGLLNVNRQGILLKDIDGLEAVLGSTL